MSAKVVAVFCVSGNKIFACLLTGKVPKSSFSSHLVHRDQAKSPVNQRVFILDDLEEAYVLVMRMLSFTLPKGLTFRPSEE